MSTWRIPNRTNNLTRGCFFFFIYVSFLYILFQRKYNYNNRKKKQIQKKPHRNVEDKSLPIVFDYVLPMRQSSLFFFFFFFSQLVLNLHPYLLVPFTIKGREPPRSPPYLFTYFLFLSLLLARNKSLSSSSLKWIYNFKQICFPPKLVANEQLQKCFFGYSWYGPLFRLRISFVIEFLTNLFPFLSFRCFVFSYIR